MTRKRVTPFTVGRGSVQPWEGSALVQVNAPFVPTLLHRLEVYKSRFTYDSDAEWGAGLDLVNRQQMELLMDIGDRLISEVRALRNGTQTDLAERDPSVDPYTLTSSTLLDLRNTIDFNGAQVYTATNDSVNLLTEIRDLLVAQGTGDTGILDRLDVMIALLGAI